MKKFAGFTTVGVLTAVTLMSCSMGGRSDFINLLEERAGDSHSAELTVQEVFGNKWSKAALVCPYDNADDVHARLGVESSPMGNRPMAESDNMIFLKSEDGATSWVQFPRKSVDFCSGDSLGELRDLHSAATAMRFELNEDEGIWVLR